MENKVFMNIIENIMTESIINMILENIKVMNKMTKSILKRTYRSVHEHDDGEHHVHEHDHCEHHEHEHPVHEQDN